MKALYRHTKSGDLFAIETDAEGRVLSASGPLLSEDLDPKTLDYDAYWNTEIRAKLGDFVRISRKDYRRLLHRLGFTIQSAQKHLFE